MKKFQCFLKEYKNLIAFTFSVIISSDFMIKSLNIIFSPLGALISGGAK